MREDVISLFRDVADLPFSDRADYYARRHIPRSVSDEVESLLRFDSHTESLTDEIAQSAHEVIQANRGAQSRIWGPYRVIRALGQGGMGVVYLAERIDGEVEQQVAIKVVHFARSHPLLKDRFLRERRILASLNHPGIARLFDAGHTSDGQPYLVMEYVNGVAIDQYCASLGLAEILKLFLSVCDAVAYAHRNLIIHRDLKPSNVLIDGSGRPKLLDFGIARIIDDADQAQTLVRMLTPDYASPEQVRGDACTTATDIYSLGAVLRKLLTGKPEIPTDIGFILGKALRTEPEERYVTVEALALDVQAFLDNRPVQARAGNRWYHAWKFLRRYWIPVTAAAVATMGLIVGLLIANRERRIAEQRFSEVRDLSNHVFKLDDQIRDLPGSTAARHALVSLSLQYLERLGGQARADKDLALEIGSAYLSVAEVQGVPGNSNLGDLSSADESLAKADSMISQVLHAEPKNPTALLRSANIAHDRMIIANTLRRPDQALEFAQRAAAGLETLLSSSDSENSDPEVARLYMNIALANSNLHRLEDAIRYARRSLDVARRAKRNDYVAAGMSVLSNALRFHGDLEEALKTVREARAFEESRPDDSARENNLIVVIWREGRILGEDGEINLNRPEEAVKAFETAYDRADRLARRDAADYGSRARFVAAARDLGDILRHSDPVRALEVYDAGLRRAAEINNSESSRDRVRLLADSSYPLRTLHRMAEAKQRIDRAREQCTRPTASASASAGTPSGSIL